MTKTIEDLLILLSNLSDLLPIFLLVIHFTILKKETSFKILLIGCSVFFILNSINYLQTSPTYAIIYPLFTLCEYTFAALFLWLQLKRSVVKKALIGSIFLFTAFII